MANTVIKTDNGKKIMLNRTHTPNATLSATEYLPATVFKVGTGNANLDITQNDLTNPVVISGVATTKVFSSGYPSLDYTNMEATIRCYLNSLEANGNLIDSIGLFNEDSSALMTDAAKFTGDSKSNTDEFVYVFKNRIR